MKDGMSMNDEVSFQAGKKQRDGISIGSNMSLALFGADGVLKEKREAHNTVTTLCHALCADIIEGSPSIIKPGWMEVGTGTGQGASDSILATYISGSRTALDSSSATAAVLTMICTMAAGVGTGAITEAGVFNVVTQNTTDLLLVASFAAVNKGADDSLVITWTLTFANPA